MARVRRKARATMRMRLNLEIAGIAAFGLALLSGIALAAPARSGALGAALAHGLIAAFGHAAWLAPVLVAIVGGIVFLEINVPRTIATLGFASLCYFLIVDAAFGRSGGAAGTLLQNGLRVLVGPTGTTLVLLLFALSLAVWISGVSLKRLIGLAVVALLRLRALVPARAPGPSNLHEAFRLPASTRLPAR
ncbi:MAG: hypothetical protein IAI50_21945, partial [Candidatus Eremiobacteraeota bacterium]|nr:hypothetical protein [Candidatus Eremiobacteraeota bacterium]